MPYWVAYKMSSKASIIYVESFRTYEEAEKHYKLLKETALPSEILIPPFPAETEDKAREKAKKLITE